MKNIINAAVINNALTLKVNGKNCLFKQSEEENSLLPGFCDILKTSIAENMQNIVDSDKKGNIEMPEQPEDLPENEKEENLCCNFLGLTSSNIIPMEAEIENAEENLHSEKTDIPVKLGTETEPNINTGNLLKPDAKTADEAIAFEKLENKAKEDFTEYVKSDDLKIFSDSAFAEVSSESVKQKELPKFENKVLKTNSKPDFQNKFSGRISDLKNNVSKNLSNTKTKVNAEPKPILQTSYESVKKEIFFTKSASIEETPVSKAENINVLSKNPINSFADRIVEKTSVQNATSVKTDVVPQLAGAIKKEAVKNLDKTFSIKLKPEGLGKVTVDLKHETGKLHISIKTELSETKELISQGINSLRHEIMTAESGIRTYELSSLTVEQEPNSFYSTFSGGQYTGSRENGQSYENSSGGSFYNPTSDYSEKDKSDYVKKHRMGLIDYLA